MGRPRKSLEEKLRRNTLNVSREREYARRSAPLPPTSGVLRPEAPRLPTAEELRCCTADGRPSARCTYVHGFRTRHACEGYEPAPLLVQLTAAWRVAALALLAGEDRELTTAEDREAELIAKREMGWLV